MTGPDEVDVYNIVMNRPRTYYLKNLTENQKKTLKKYDEFNKIKNLTVVTRENQLKQIARLGANLKKEYKDITQQDVNNWLNRNIKPYSRVTYQLYFGKFFKWLGKKHVEKWFEKIENAYDKTIAPSELWTPEDINSLLRVYPESMHKALVATLFDTGARVSEICSMNIEDVEFIAGNATVFLRESKSRKRRVELLFASKELIMWYNIRKSNGQPNDPLFLSKCNRNRNQRLTPGGVTEILKYGTRLLHTTKHLNPHLLRHSMTSYLRAKGYPDALHRIRMGLSSGSTVLERYTHVTDEQVSIGARKAFGIKEIEVKKEKPNPLIGVTCPRCGHLNRTTDTLCEKCFYSIDYENTGMEVEFLEMLRTNFAKATNLDVLFRDYRRFKQELNLVENFKMLLQGKTEIETDVVRRYFSSHFKLDDDQIIHFIETLMQEDVADVKGNFIVLTSIEKLDDLIQSCKKFVSLDSKYKISKQGDE